MIIIPSLKHYTKISDGPDVVGVSYNLLPLAYKSMLIVLESYHGLFMFQSCTHVKTNVVCLQLTATEFVLEIFIKIFPID
jgi:hypothetical protein